MIKSKHKIISVVLCVALVLCALLSLAMSVGAASGDTIYVKVNNGWTTSTIYCYMWNGSGETKNAEWPGQQMTLVDSANKIYSYKLTGAYSNIIFNEGNGGQQTADLVYDGNGGDGKIYDLAAGTWSQYAQPTSGATQATQATQATTPSGSGITVYLKNTAGWSQPRCYMWNSSTDTNAGWPGANMTFVGDDIWMYSASKTFANCIFNPGGDDGKTADLSNIQNGYLYDYSTGKWEVYDTSPLQVKAYSADPATSVYTGMEVTLAAQAVSSEGDVSYKFSVNGNVIRDFATSNTATWVPDAVGAYTITFDFKDTAGNENSRTLSLTVADDSALSNPIIKTLAPANGNYVKTGSDVTVNVGAGGGKTGTELLFYKYVVVDPDGNQNTPYYTLNSAYTFKPYTEGQYQITVYVQASDNSTVTKTFTLNATGGDIPTSAPTTVKPTQATQPTTVKPTQATQPTTVKPTQATQPTTVKPTQATQPTTQGGNYQKGDVNKDGKVNIKDATYIQKRLAEYSGYEVSLELGDMNGDGRITIKDVTLIQKAIADMY